MPASDALSTAQRALVEEIDAILRAGSRRLDVAAMTTTARASGLLQPSELQALERRGRLPDWLLDALGLGGDYQASTRFTTVRVSSGRRWELTPPTILHGAALPSSFEMEGASSPDVDLVSGEGAELVLNNRARACFLDDGYVPALTDVDNLWSWSMVREWPAVRLPGRSLILFVEGSQLLSHWLLDTLPRLGALSAAGRSPADYDHVVLASAPHPFHVQSLQALGIPSGKVVTRGEAGPRLRCDAFDFVTPVRQSYLAEPWVYAFVEQLFGAPSPARPFRKLFISRQKARRRRIVDEAWLHPVLERRGYQIVNAEDHALKDMARMCAEATAIAGPHGAGIANSVFARPGARVLEIFGAHISPEYWRLAGQRGLTYACCQARDEAGRAFDAEDLAQTGLRERQAAGMSVSPAELERLLDDFDQL